MKTMFITILILFSSSCSYCQSVVIFDAGTTLEVGIGADMCGDSLVMNVTYTGNGTFCGALVPVTVITQNIPERYGLFQNYPNPFNPSSNIKFDIPNQAGAEHGRGVFVRIEVYDILGREAAILVNEQLKPGSYEISWNASGFPSGMYFYKLTAADFSDVKKMVLVK